MLRILSYIFEHKGRSGGRRSLRHEEGEPRED